MREHALASRSAAAPQTALRMPGLDRPAKRWHLCASFCRSAGVKLTGFNHYADCGCGWCVNYGGRSRTNRPQLLEELQRRDALHLLKTNSARSINRAERHPGGHRPEASLIVRWSATFLIGRNPPAPAPGVNVYTIISAAIR
jgi:hypothetical protein